MKILSVFGTRPEAIKMAPVVRALQCCSAVESVVCVTAQHRHMLDQVLRLFEIEPAFDLDMMQANQSLSQVTANVLTRLEPVLARVKPDWVLVQGDTTTAMTASLAAYYQRIKVGHIEAGLRTWDKYQPFPEEVNRQIADKVCDWHFAPTEWARQNLLREGVRAETIRVTGNTVIDALRWVADLPPTPAIAELLARWDPALRLILVTAHRRENFGEPFENICHALRDLAERYRGAAHLVYPVHLNPHVQEPVYRWLRHVPNVTLLEPLDYFQFVHIIKRAWLVLTDSGGIQEEAPGLGKPVLGLREMTERPEAIQAGTVQLVGTDRARIVEAVTRLWQDRAAYDGMARAVNPYGDGRAAERIVETLIAC